MEKSANQLWKESGTSLSFADWIEREKDKGTSIANKLLEDIVTPFQVKTETDNNTLKISKTFLGMPDWVLIVGVAIISGAIYYKYNKK